MAHTPIPTHITGLSWGALLLAGLSAVGTFYMEYQRTDRDVVQRVSALEAHQQDGDKKLDHIQSQVDKLVDWALGKQR